MSEDSFSDIGAVLKSSERTFLAIQYMVEFVSFQMPVLVVFSEDSCSLKTVSVIFGAIRVLRDDIFWNICGFQLSAR